MPSHVPLPSIDVFRSSFANGVTGLMDEFADTADGSMYDVIGSVGAIVFSRESQRDQDLFRSNYFDGANGTELTSLIKNRFNIDRTLDSYGVGTATLSRPTNSGGSGTIWTGTRVLVSRGPFTSPFVYIVSSDTTLSASSLSVNVPIRSDHFGSGAKINANRVTNVLSIGDAMFDSSISVQSVICSDGTDFEQDSDFKARVRATRQKNRKGYIAQIIQACDNQGALNVALFPSYFNGSVRDRGLNYCYVGDQNYNGNDALTSACDIVLESVRVLGADLFTLPMVRTPLTIISTVTLIDDPGSFNLNLLQDSITASWVQYFTGNLNAFGFTLSGLSGSAKSVVSDIQSIAFTTPSSDITVTTLVGGVPVFPASLPRYVLRPEDVIITFVGPS